MARIAIIGTGIAGLACAEMLRERHDVSVFEAQSRAGGHARTLMVGDIAVDTGFIVYNEVNYPLLTQFFAHLAVATQPSDMSFGFRSGDGRLEYAADSLPGLFAQPKNLLSYRHWSMLADILRFFRVAPRVLEQPGEPTLGEMLAEMKLGRAFADHFLIPMGAAIWSTPAEQILNFPAKSFIRFFQNHGLLSAGGQHPWRTVTGGSAVYVDSIVARLAGRLRLGTAVRSITPEADGVAVAVNGDPAQHFDKVVIACHADEALRMLASADPLQREILGAFEFRDNTAVLHGDARVMPKARRAWASWNYAASGNTGKHDVSLTYWMNRLQSLPGRDLFVTLNPEREIDRNLVHDVHVFRHPLFSQKTMDAQARIAEIQGRGHIWFCGAWQRYGFHEDGIWSAERVARQLGSSPAWI